MTINELLEPTNVPPCDMSEAEKVLEEMKWFRNVLCKGGKVPEYYEAQVDILTKAICLLQNKNKPAAEVDESWTPCSTGMPYTECGERSDDVLATCGYKDVEDTSIRWIKVLYYEEDPVTGKGNWYDTADEVYNAKVYA